jgi:hypothetical protein
MTNPILDLINYANEISVAKFAEAAASFAAAQQHHADGDAVCEGVLRRSLRAVLLWGARGELPCVLSPGGDNVVETLAAHYGHFWVSLAGDAGVSVSVVLRALMGTHSDEVAAKIAALRPLCAVPQLWGGVMPSLSHITGSGRLSWEIEADLVRFEIRRPQGVVLKATLDHGARYARVNWSVEIPFGERHVAALREALNALGADVAPGDMEAILGLCNEYA